MKHFLSIVCLFAVTAIACNLPTEQMLTATPIELEIPAGEVSQAAPEVTDSLGDIPDIAGTVAARITSTPDETQDATITGGISYPSEGHPDIRIYAVRTDRQYYKYVEVEQNAGSFTIQVPPGEYYLLADAEIFNTQEFDGAYTVYAKCVSENSYDACPDSDYTLIAVLVQPGQTVEGININDWLAPAGTYPLVPGR